MTYQRPPSTGQALRLHMNENTAGCSPAVVAALARMMAGEIAQYPDYGPATARCEARFGVPEGWVQLTNGLDEGLHAISQSMPDGFEAVVLEPAFEMYAIGVEAAGGQVRRVPPGPDFQFSLDALLDALTPGVRLVFLTSPNNPTGLSLPDGVVERVAAAAPGALIVVDEAYADFSGRTSLPLLSRPDNLDNLIVGRTFSKGHGLAGLRVGALVANPRTLAGVRRQLPPFSVNTAAITALGAALDDEAYLAARVAEAREAKAMVYEACDRLGLRYWPSDANFVLVRVGDAAPAIVAALGARGIVIRDRSTMPGCEGCVRFTAMVREHTQRVLEALEDVLATRGD